MIINSTTRKINEQAATLEKVKNKELTQQQATIILKLSLRQIKRKFKRYLIHGTEGLIHKNKGRNSNNKLDSEQRIIIVDFLHALKQRVGEFFPTYGLEKVIAILNISVSLETVRKIMIEQKLWIEKTRKAKRHY